MATVRSTTNSDIHSQLNGYVTDYLTKHMYDANTSWPLRKTIRLPKQTELEAHYTHIRAQDEAIRNWAQQHHCETSEKTKVISNGIVRQTSQLIDSVTIPDLNTALNITTPQTRKLYQREHQRAHTITNQFNLDSNTSIDIAKILKNHDDTDFNLVIQAAHYFATHNTENMTPRMVPIPGFSAKWLGKTTSNRCKAICKLLKREQLALNDRHGEIRLRLLDTQHHNQPDLIVTQPWTDGAPHDITHIIIVENKDTYQAIPTTEHAICIFGNGHAATRIKTLLPWITTTPHIIYWGDIDADGLEILSELRQTGITCDSILMDSTAYKTYEPYGTKLDTKKTTPQNTRPQTNTRTHATRKKLIRTTLHREKHNLPTNRTRTHPHQRRNDNTPQPTPMEHNTPQIEHLFEIITKMRYPKQLEQRTTTSGGKPWQPNATTQQTATS